MHLGAGLVQVIEGPRQETESWRPKPPPRRRCLHRRQPVLSPCGSRSSPVTERTVSEITFCLKMRRTTFGRQRVAKVVQAPWSKLVVRTPEAGQPALDAVGIRTKTVLGRKCMSCRPTCRLIIVRSPFQEAEGCPCGLLGPPSADQSIEDHFSSGLPQVPAISFSLFSFERKGSSASDVTTTWSAIKHITVLVFCQYFTSILPLLMLH